MEKPTSSDWPPGDNGCATSLIRRKARQIVYRANLPATDREDCEQDLALALPVENSFLTEIDSDFWKTWVHQRLTTPVSNPGSMTLFQAPAQDHLAIAKHLTAEMKIEEFVAGKGMITRWERKRRQNHWFDALYNACAAGHYLGVRVVKEEEKEPPPPKKQKPADEPKKRPWIDTERWRENQQRMREGRRW